MSLGYITIATPIIPGQALAMENYLRKCIRPGFDPTSIIRCQAALRFDKISSLHFCAMLILNTGKHPESDACLVFEATFDGARTEFLDELIAVAPEAVQAIYEKCVGFPASGMNVPSLVKDFLIRNDAGAQTFFSGNVGRSAEQIKGEKAIRDDIVAFVRERRLKEASVNSFVDVQREVQQEVIRNRPKNRWAEQPAVIRWEMAQRKLIAAAVAATIGVAGCLLGAVILLGFGLGPSATLGSVLALSREVASALSEYGPLQGIAAAFDRWRLPIPFPVLLLVIAWWGLLLFELFIELQKEQRDPRKANVFFWYLVYLSTILRYTLTIFMIGFSVLWLDYRISPAPTLLVSAISVFGSIVALVVLKYIFTSLQLVVQFRQLSPGKEVWRQFSLDLIRLGMVVAVVWVILIVGSHMPETNTETLNLLVPAIHVMLVLTIYAFVGVMAFYLFVIPALALVVRLRERADRSCYRPATDLVTMPLDPSVYEREEGGVNKYQNHFASLTEVKPGRLRAWLLRTTLFVIGLLGRFWYNQGDLGGIPTIFAARWLLLDGGRRLLFLTNYGGAWESYLDEFIDMGAVKGINAIWSNTFIGNGERYNFPETMCYFWQGAQAERPFKAYVRQSQVETIVWYGAYPTLSVVNVNANSDLRQALFAELAPYELDATFLKAGI